MTMLEHTPMTEARDRRPVYPVFKFGRRPEVGLAGRLYFNTFGRRPKMRARREITEIIARLTAEAQAGRIPLDGVVVGWPGDGRKSESAVDTNDEAVMEPWIKRAFKVEVRLLAQDVGAPAAYIEA
jgi:hypothetical protein